VTKDANTGGDVQPLGQRGQHFAHSQYRCLEAVEGCIPSHSELGLAGLAEEVLDTVVLAMATVAYQCMDGSVRDAAIITLPGRTGIPLCVDPLLSSPWTLDLAPGYDVSLLGFFGHLIRFGSTLAAVIGCPGTQSASPFRL
jgi:hypothetical protein